MKNGVRSPYLTYFINFDVIFTKIKQKGFFMARPLRIKYAGAFYHIIQRGNERKEIFKSNQDREKFLKCCDPICCVGNENFHFLQRR